MDFDDALAPCRLLIGQQKKQIDVRRGRHHPVAVSARRDDRHVLRRGRILGPVKMLGGAILNELNELVLKLLQTWRKCTHRLFAEAVLVLPFARCTSAP